MTEEKKNQQEEQSKTIEQPDEQVEQQEKTIEQPDEQVEQQEKTIEQSNEQAEQQEKIKDSGDPQPNNKTPKKKGNSMVKTFAVGTLGGLVGAGIILAGYTTYEKSANHTESASTKKTTVSNVNYNVQSDITKVVKKVQGGVVSVINLKKESTTDFGNLGNNRNENKDGMQEAGEGSGVVYKKDGEYAYIVTNNHVVSGSDALQVVLNNGTKLKAKLIGADEYSDLAVLRVSSKDITTVLEFGDSNKINVGEPAIAIGSPLGSDYANSVTEGIISAKNRTITTQAESGGTVSMNAIQTDAAINPGNSGGPLINAAGQVIGINSIKISNSGSDTSVEGMGFAIPSDTVVNIINQLEKNGKIERPALGVSMIDLSYISEEQQEKILKVPLSVKQGVVVKSVQSGSPAQKAGLQEYDVITKVDGKEITSSTELQNILYNKQVGDKMTITYYHEDSEKTTTVNLTMSSSDLK